MNRDVTQASTSASNRDATDIENPELKELYTALAVAVSTWHAAMKTAQEKDSSNDLKKVRELDQQVELIIASINKILG